MCVQERRWDGSLDARAPAQFVHPRSTLGLMRVPVRDQSVTRSKPYTFSHMSSCHSMQSLQPPSLPRCPFARSLRTSAASTHWRAQARANKTSLPASPAQASSRYLKPSTALPRAKPGKAIPPLIRTAYALVTSPRPQPPQPLPANPPFTTPASDILRLRHARVLLFRLSVHASRGTPHCPLPFSSFTAPRTRACAPPASPPCGSCAPCRPPPCTRRAAS